MGKNCPRLSIVGALPKPASTLLARHLFLISDLPSSPPPPGGAGDRGRKTKEQRSIIRRAFQPSSRIFIHFGAAMQTRGATKRSWRHSNPSSYRFVLLCQGKTPYERSGVALSPSIKNEFTGKILNISPPIFQIDLFTI